MRRLPSLVGPLLLLIVSLALPLVGHADAKRRIQQPACTIPAQSPAGTKCVILSDGDVMYYGRVLMTTPIGNNALSNRQSTVLLPLMVNDDAKNPNKGAPPVIQLHIESVVPLGLGNSMVVYQTYRDEIDGMFRIIVNASAFDSHNEPPGDYFLNFVVVGELPTHR